MKQLIKRRWFIVTCVVVLLGIVGGLTFVITGAGRGRLPKDIHFAELASDESMSAKEIYDAYDPAADPAHPVLDVKTSLQISNLGSRPGEPRPQSLAVKDVTPAPSAKAASKKPSPPSPTTLTPRSGLGGLQPRITPDLTLPDRLLDLPDFYIVDTVQSPQFTDRAYALAWKYTGGRDLTYAVSLSTDGGRTFTELARGLTSASYDVTLPKKPVEAAKLRVEGMLDGRMYKRVDSSVFKIVAAPRPAPSIQKRFVDPQVKYVDIPGLRISSEPALPVWFKVKNAAKDADALIWQLSKVPFVGTAESFGAEGGIVASGTVNADKNGEFSLDLKRMCATLSKPNPTREPGAPFLASQSVYQLYARVVPLSKSGKPIGDPGTGLGFTYGAPSIDPGPLAAAMAREPKIQMQLYVPYYWEHRWERITPAVLDRDIGDESDSMLFAGTDGPHTEDFGSVVSGIEDAAETVDKGVVASVEDAVAGQPPNEKGAGSRIISKAVKVEIQVATSPFNDSLTLGLFPPNGLVYSFVDTAPNIAASKDYGSSYYSPLDHGIEYDKFVPSKEALEAMGGINYYVRGIFYVPDSTNPSVLRPYPSETLQIAFRATDASANEVKKLVVKSDIPYVQFLKYEPVQWQHPNYDEYFEVTRDLEAEEMTFSVKRGNDHLLSYAQAVALYGWTRDTYQARLDDMLPAGAVIHYVKGEPGFWDEFFGLLNDIYSGVQKAYADAKESAVGLVDEIPLIGDDARGYLKIAARAAIDYGLASIGLPPTLPNIDQLASGGMDYVMRVAVDEALRSAGVSPDSPAAAEITEKVRKEVADGMSSELTKAVLARKQNPLNVDFLRLELKKLYAPAYIDVFVCNYSKTRTTRSGDLYFTSGSGFDVYKSAKVTIPALKPGEHTTIRVYLDHLRNQTEGYGAAFDKKYNGTYGQPYKMSVYSSFQLPHVNLAAKEQGIKAAPLPYVTQFVYDHDPYSYRYEREFVPANPIYEPDGTPKTNDFLD